MKIKGKEVKQDKEESAQIGSGQVSFLSSLVTSMPSRSCHDGGGCWEGFSSPQSYSCFLLVVFSPSLSYPRLFLLYFPVAQSFSFLFASYFFLCLSFYICYSLVNTSLLLSSCMLYPCTSILYYFPISFPHFMQFISHSLISSFFLPHSFQFFIFFYTP